MMHHRHRRGLHWGLFALTSLIACSGSSSNTAETATPQAPATSSAQSPPPAVTPQQAHGAVFLEQSVPSQMVADAEYTVSIRMRNTGSATWTAADNYRIGSVNPPDNEVWGLRRVGVANPVAPGMDVTFNFALKAPQTPGEYNFQWRMVQDGGEWFGDTTPNLPIAVSARTSKEPR